MSGKIRIHDTLRPGSSGWVGPLQDAGLTFLFLLVALAASAGWPLLAWADADKGPATIQVAAPPASPRAAPAPRSDPLLGFGLSVTGGAAPGYVEDRACALCHDALYRSYQAVGMAQSFYRPRPDKVIERFPAGPYFHVPSQRYFEMSNRDGRLFFKRYQLDDQDRPINVLVEEVDWILGSGHHARNYLYQTEAGELYQLPVAWYGQTRTWGMAPGYDRPQHSGVQRRVRRECLFCHNAYPDVPEGSDAYMAAQVFPVELPEGTGCQRCHGPGARHVRMAVQGDAEIEELRAAIVNPGRLEPRLRNDICYACHMAPSVALPGIRRFGRGDYAFRPGQSLADYLVQVDVAEAGKAYAERFEISHHPDHQPYRLEQSRCFRESRGALSCLTCHDPHRKVPPVARAAHYRAACLGCHAVDARGLPVMAQGGTHPAVESGDCTSCHMPKRRPQDVVRVTMTDHFIRRRPGGSELLAPLEESDPVLEDVWFLEPGRAPQGALGEIYRAVVVGRAGGGASVAALDRLEQLLAAHPLADAEPYLDLAIGQLRQRRYGALEVTVARILERSPGNPLALEWLGAARAGMGRTEDAARLVREAVERNPKRPEAHFNLGLFTAALGRTEEAVSRFERALELRPNFVAAWFHLGKALATLGRNTEAAHRFRRALQLEPSHSGAYLAIGQALIVAGQRDEALRYWRHGARVAARPAAVAEALAKATAPLPRDD